MSNAKRGRCYIRSLTSVGGVTADEVKMAEGYVIPCMVRMGVMPPVKMFMPPCVMHM